jgi:hypothetical protein
MKGLSRFAALISKGNRIAKSLAVVTVFTFFVGQPMAHARTLLGQPVPDSLMVQQGDLEWVWASPCSGHTICSSINPAVTGQGFRYATDAEMAIRPPALAFFVLDDLGNIVGQLCASTYFDPRHDTCDTNQMLSGDVVGFPDGGFKETILVRSLVVDQDADGVADDEDNCPVIPNPEQGNQDGDATGDACDQCPVDPFNDGDGDGVCGDIDNCPVVANPEQSDADGDGTGDACNDDMESDGDEWSDALDNCPGVANANQFDGDGDGLGDACDACPLDAQNDADADGFCADVDNCPTVDNPDQTDTEGDGLGNACDADDDNDEVNDGDDNCPLQHNPFQEDFDGDGDGDACDVDVDGDGIVEADDACPLTPAGLVVNGEGCAIAQVCPAENDWKNSGAYIKCLKNTAQDFLSDGLISKRERAAIIAAAASNGAVGGGKKKK